MRLLRPVIRSSAATIPLWITLSSAASRSWERSKKLSNEKIAGLRCGDTRSHRVVAAHRHIVFPDLASGLSLALLHRNACWPGRASVQDGEVPVDGDSGGCFRRRLDSR